MFTTTKASRILLVVALFIFLSSLVVVPYFFAHAHEDEVEVDSAESVDDSTTTRGFDRSNRLLRGRATSLDSEAPTTTRAERRAEHLTDLQLRVVNRLMHIFDIAYQRMHAAIDRLENIAERLASRIETLETEHGADLSESSALLETANELIDDAATKLADVKADSDEILGMDPLPDNFRTLLHELREDYREVKDAIKDAHAALVDVVVSIRLGLAEDEESETIE